MGIERISIELTNKCGKGCYFCYNRSQNNGRTTWQNSEVVNFVKDCAANGTKAVSFGGGEPLEYPQLFDIVTNLRGILFRSITSNGLLLQGDRLTELIAAAPDKVHLSIHFPERDREVNRVIFQVKQLIAYGIRSGVNLLVSRSNLEAAKNAAAKLHRSGIKNDRIVYLPMRGFDTPTPQQIAKVAASKHFQSMSCLLNCGKSPRFCSISWDKKVAWCSYTSDRGSLKELTANSLEAALTDLSVSFCGNKSK